MNTLCHVLQLLSVASLGIFAGSMLTEGLVLVPYWRSLPPREFFAWYAANDQRLLGFFGPLTMVTAALTQVASLGSFVAEVPGRWPTLVAALLSLTVLSTFFIYFKQANESFDAASLGHDDLPAELRRWAAWHWMRTGMSLAALTAALIALR